MVDWGRIGLGIATGGMSELGGARPALDAAAGSDYTKNLLFGGDATKSIDPRLQHYDQATTQLGQMAQNAAGRVAPSAQAVNAGRVQLGAPSQLGTAQIDQSRGGMLGVANRLQGVATGQQAGAGELAVNRQLGQANAAQQAMARMARGPGSALAYRTAARNTMDNGLAGAGMAAQAQMADQQAANQQLGQAYGTLLGSDVTQAGQNAQLSQQAMLQQGAMDQQTTLANAQAGNATAIANLQAQLAQTGMNDQQQIQALGQMLGWDQATINAQLQRAQVAAGDKGILPGLIAGGAQIAGAYATGGASMAMPKAAPAAAPAPVQVTNPYGWTPEHG
jgi:hypothetical protein